MARRLQRAHTGRTPLHRTFRRLQGSQASRREIVSTEFIHLLPDNKSNGDIAYFCETPSPIDPGTPAVGHGALIGVDPRMRVMMHGTFRWQTKGI